jgi:hypothetical protein
MHSFRRDSKVKFENTGFEQLKADLNRLDEVMQEKGLIREGQWDYERVTYDKKFEVKESVYYLRVRGYAVEGDVGAHKAVIQLMTPLLGKYYYPHGVEYGDEEVYPQSLVNQCQTILETLKTEIGKFSI